MYVNQGRSKRDRGRAKGPEQIQCGSRPFPRACLQGSGPRAHAETDRKSGEAVPAGGLAQQVPHRSRRSTLGAGAGGCACGTAALATLRSCRPRGPSSSVESSWLSFAAALRDFRISRNCTAFGASSPLDSLVVSSVCPTATMPLSTIWPPGRQGAPVPPELVLLAEVEAVLQLEGAAPGLHVDAQSLLTSPRSWAVWRRGTMSARRAVAFARTMP
mmetsp:Transcript_4845/g.15238  ORF Transcript_4845/g.15238 Transcript_4845/m.15238 type:complete len:216 (-) Transcript_4845:415-1062(-)